MVNERGLGVYVHVPFCKSRCVYCDFVSFVDENFEEYTHYLLREIELYRGTLRRGIQTLYVGGGTPSVFPVGLLGAIVKSLEPFFLSDLEFTVEANPDSFSEDLARAYRSLGVNRLSLGLQSADDSVLRRSGRRYDYETFIRKFDLARRFFDNVNVDFILGLPGETWYTLESDVIFVNDFRPDHVSVYILEVHDEETVKTYLKRPDEQTYKRHDEFTKSLKTMGYERYEISSFALNGKYCQHNLKYWFNENYIGLGVSAGGHVDGLRYNNFESMNDYFLAISENRYPRSYESKNSPLREALETLFMALRTKWGIEPTEVQSRTGVDVGAVVRKLSERFDFFDGVKLDERGMDMSNFFFANLLLVWEEEFGDVDQGKGL